MAWGSTLVEDPPAVASRPRESRSSAGAQPARYASLVRTLALAAAVAGIGELLVHRVLSPVVAHVPGMPGSAAGADLVRAFGEAMMGATALLVPLAALGLVADLARRRRPLATLLLGAVVLTLASVWIPGGSLPLAAYAATFVALGGSVILGVGSRWYRGALAIFVIGFVAGVLPYAANAASSAGLVTSAQWSPALLRGVAEGALLASAIVLGAVVARRGISMRATPWLAGTAGLVSAAVLATQPEHAAVVSLWASGLALGFSPALYVIAAVGLTVAFTEWTGVPQTRLRAAGLALVVVAGVAPAVVHHNLTALLGVTLLAMPPAGKRED